MDSPYCLKVLTYSGRLCTLERYKLVFNNFYDQLHFYKQVGEKWVIVTPEENISEFCSGVKMLMAGVKPETER